MLDLLQSLSIESGALIIACASAVCAIVWARIALWSLKWSLALGTPAVLSYVLYWSPVWLGANPSEYSGWAPLLISTWFTAGVIPSVVVIVFAKAATHENAVPHV